ncbi:hypothetical protein, partial [Schleiferia thermophila]
CGRPPHPSRKIPPSKSQSLTTGQTLHPSHPHPSDTFHHTRLPTKKSRITSTALPLHIKTPIFLGNTFISLRFACR